MLWSVYVKKSFLIKTVKRYDEDARPENARLENAAPKCRGRGTRKCGLRCGKSTATTARSALFSLATLESRLSRANTSASVCHAQLRLQTKVANVLSAGICRNDLASLWQYSRHIYMTVLAGDGKDV